MEEKNKKLLDKITFLEGAIERNKMAGRPVGQLKRQLKQAQHELKKIETQNTKNMAVKLTQEQVDEMYKLHKSRRKTLLQLSDEFGVSDSLISQIIRGKHKKYIPSDLRTPECEATPIPETEPCEPAKKSHAPGFGEIVAEMEESGAVPKPASKPKQEKAKPAAPQPVKVDINLTQENIFEALTGSMLAMVNKQIAKDLGNIVTKEVAEQVASLQPNVVKIGERVEVKMDDTLHKDFEECLFILNQEKQLYMSGAAGTGKTTMGEKLAKAMELPFGHISCSAGMSEAHVLGRMLFDGNFVGTSFLEIFENGGVFLFDEIDAADPNLLLVINSALANGIMSVPNRQENPIAKRHENCYIICAGNTWGSGSSEYHGRNYLDAAFIDRFSMSKVHVSYDEELEKKITKNDSITTVMQDIRKNITKTNIDRMVSTRTIVSAYKHKVAGRNVGQIVNRFTEDWTEEEKKKGLEGINLSI